MRRFLLTCLLVLAGLVSPAATQYLFQKPALRSTQIVFCFAGDLWSVPRQGGDARRLTTGPGVETDPVFSPDGAWIAFTGEYDGNVDVFVMPAAGGAPKRLTYHPGDDYARGWTPDGKRVLFISGRANPTHGARLFTIPADGGFPDEIPLPIALEGSYSPDGLRLAYVPVYQWQEAWKRYRGGQTRKIWIADLSDSSVVEIPRENSNDFNPMWAGDRIYFLSDRNGPVSLFSYDTRARQVKQLVANGGLDFKSASAGPGAIVYEQFGSLHLYDLKSGRTKPVEVRLAGDLPEVRPRLVNVGKRLGYPDISPNGARAVFEARGEILTVPAEKGDPRNLTNTPGAHEREPAWSPDGKTIAYFSDESGEYALHLREQSGMGTVTRISLGEKPAFYYAPRWSPDSKKIAYIDSHLGVWYVDLDAKKPVLVDKDYLMSERDLSPVWSPDSKWLAYRKQLKSLMSAICLYSLADARSTQVTDGMSEAKDPVFDKDGKYLYFTASTDSGPAMQFDVLSRSRPVTRSIYLVVLAKDQSSPLAPESDEEKEVKEVKEAEEAKSKKVVTVKIDLENIGQRILALPMPPRRYEGLQIGKAGVLCAIEAPAPWAPPGARADEEKEVKEVEEAKSKKVVTVKIDLENIGQRILALPMPPRRYEGLQIGKEGVLYAIEAPAPWTPPGAGAERNLTVHRFDLSKRKSDVAIGGVRSFRMSSSGEKMLYQQGDRWFIAAPKPMEDSKGAAPPPPPEPGKDPLQTEGLEVRADPRTEWRQMYHEAWRIEREFFYDPNYHGLDLKAAEKRYEPYLENLASRQDLNYIFTEMLGELSAGHVFLGGGDKPEVKQVQTGLLGAEYRIENGRYRFARVHNGENWNPDLKAPLTQPGVNVAAGEYLLAVRGRELPATDNIYSFFEGTAGKQVVLRVGPDPSGANSREVTVVPVADERRLRHLAWIEGNRRQVDKLTNGRVAYVYMPDTSSGGYTAFNRYFFAQVGKEAAIIDERFNGGGQIATDIIEHLRRPLMRAVTLRDGAEVALPLGAIFGPKVMIVNEFAGSGGDLMPWFFRQSGVGKLVGKRTWGGVVGLSGVPELMDGGVVLAPCCLISNASGQWDIENQGVAPDIEVELDPKAVRQGRDPQLEKAVEVVLEELEKNGAPTPKRPSYPNYHLKEAPRPVTSR